MKKLVWCFLLAMACLIVVGCGKVSQDQQTEELPAPSDEYGTVETESVATLVAKFNARVLENGSLNPASDDYRTISEQRYWYGLVTGISLVVVPKEFQNDTQNEIVDYMVLYVEKDNENEAMVPDYLKALIQANNDAITDDEVEKLLTEAKSKSSTGETSNNGKGISIGYIENDDNDQYQVIRLYEE